MKTIVIGATGTIGKAVAGLLSDKGYEVVGASRSSANSIDIDNPASIDGFFAEIEDVDAIICAAGNASFGALKDLTDEQIEVGLKSKLLGQINVVRKGISKLKANGIIILTGGILAYTPWPETTNIATVNAGIEGFVKATALELDEGRRILVVHPPFVKETAEAMGMDASPWPAAAKVAGTYLNAIAGNANGKAVFVEGYAP